jgi:2-polyprenyl-6-methoxyphenol hydroxylase-like FAD-dependent oxidoreductase
VLIDAVDASTLRLGAECTGFEQDEHGVSVRFAGGREDRGDVLIGADGLHSVVRAQLLGPARPRWTGYAAWRAIVPHADFTTPDTVTVHWGPGARLITYRLRGGRSYWLALANAQEGASDSPAGPKRDVLAAYKEWPEPLLAMISATDESAIHRTDIHDRAPIKQWSYGRVTLLGDAAHPTTPNLAQGAAYALEDGVVLGKAFREAETAVEALSSYETKRLQRAAAMVNGSYRMGTLARWKQPLAVAARDRLIRTVTSRRRFLTQLERDLTVEF